ncbi:glutathione peroxidase [Schleiferia thermophila]|jgi:glutathione peroxidase|uniref:Glutathione peroxidase n=1 Tax=Schleiferia thermophila TaxID=884107 RepID=A0A369A4H5_9FLAO|nr:glutathione peroxidase [Schleiferia thermophila]KFD39006.1 glutathione peroxidase [Schleiferia thermophila str. Yellowstone]RCX02354.1 glutathione peroxidase [Schleiferia thermophila]GCD80762.1 glutathione peroxidase [Schleiferia thermophila]
MKKVSISLMILVVSSILFSAGIKDHLARLSKDHGQSKPVSFYSLKAKTIDGKDFDFSTLKGKRVLIVNVASECGFTPQYKKLQKLFDDYKDKNFVILGFPCNDFGGQEPGSTSEIKSFCEKNYGVTFQLMEKVSIKGPNPHPVYQWLTKKELNGKSNASVRWNFHKFLIDENGQWVEDYGSMTDPMSEKIVAFAARKS